MTTHYFISTIRPIPEFHEPDNNHPFISGEAYKEDLPFNLPYVYEVGSDEVELILFLDEFMLLGDIVEYYIYEEGRNGIPLSENFPNESRTINLLKKTYKDEYGEYKLDTKKWSDELSRKIIGSKRSITTFIKI